MLAAVLTGCGPSRGESGSGGSGSAAPVGGNASARGGAPASATAAPRLPGELPVFPSGGAGDPGSAERAMREVFRLAAASAVGIPEEDRKPSLTVVDHHPCWYFLIYGTPVPGYRASQDTTAISAEIMTTLLDACTTATAASTAVPVPAGPGTPFTAHLAEHRGWADGHPAPPEALRRFLAFWTRLHGVLSLELAGHFSDMGFDPAALFAAELDELRPATDRER